MLRRFFVVAGASLVTACATDELPDNVRVYSSPTKTLQSVPYEVATWPDSPGISRRDIRDIESLVARNPQIRKPIVRMMAWKPDSVQVVTGSDEHRGDTYNLVHAVKRHGRWRLAEITIEHAFADRATIQKYR
jgi:hypothetical protein